MTKPKTRPVPRVPSPSLIKIIEATALGNGATREIVRGLSHEAYDPKEKAVQDAMKHVALAQPHRQGDDSRERGTALGRFCLDHKPRALGEHMSRAGEEYAMIVREFKRAMEFGIVGAESGSGGYSSLTQDQIEARRELAERRKRDADAVLTAIYTQSPRRVANALERLTYDDLDPPDRDAGLLVHAMAALSHKFGFTPRSIRDDEKGS